MGTGLLLSLLGETNTVVLDMSKYSAGRGTQSFSSVRRSNGQCIIERTSQCPTTEAELLLAVLWTTHAEDVTCGGNPTRIAKVHLWTGSVWQQLGSEMTGGWVVSISSSGSRIVVGVIGRNCVTKMFDWTGSVWRQNGPNLDGVCLAVAISPDGNSIVGGDNFYSDVSFLSGIARVFRCTPGSLWQPRGQALVATVYY